MDLQPLIAEVEKNPLQAKNDQKICELLAGGIRDGVSFSPVPLTVLLPLVLVIHKSGRALRSQISPST